MKAHKQPAPSVSCDEDFCIVIQLKSGQKQTINANG